MQSLQRFGYEVVFTPSAEFAAADQKAEALDAIGVTACRAPYYGSIEEVLRRQAGEFDLSICIASRTLPSTANSPAITTPGPADLQRRRSPSSALCAAGHAEGRPELGSAQPADALYRIRRGGFGRRRYYPLGAGSRGSGKARCRRQNPHRDVVNDTAADSNSVCAAIGGRIHRRLRSRAKSRCGAMADRRNHAGW